MKKRQVFLAAFAATMLIPAVAWAIPANHGGSKSKLYENDDRRAETL